jgi:hypothetical protein
MVIKQTVAMSLVVAPEAATAKHSCQQQQQSTSASTGDRPAMTRGLQQRLGAAETFNAVQCFLF